MILEKRIAKELSRYFERENLSTEERKYILEELNRFGEYLDDEAFMEYLPKKSPVYKILANALGISDRTKKCLAESTETVIKKLETIDFKTAISEAFEKRRQGKKQ